MSEIRLLLSDVDGTLVSPTKELTPATVEAVRRLREHDVLFALTSGRPPRGTTMLFSPLGLNTPVAAFNGGLIVDTTLAPLRQFTLDDDVAHGVIDVIQHHGVSVWVFQGTDWLVLDPDGPHVGHEAAVCQFSPTVVRDFKEINGNLIKVVGVSDDAAAVDAARAVLEREFGDLVSATNSQSYYLDVTRRDANKGAVVDFLAETYGLERGAIATIGDMSNDLLMFARGGLSIAMGNGSDEVRATADVTTRANDADGFAYAVEQYVLG